MSATTSFEDAGPFTSKTTYRYVVTAYKVDKLGTEFESGYSNEVGVTLR